MPGKRVTFDEQTWSALDLLARDRKMDFQELAAEAFGDLLKKYRRPADLKTALRRSAERTASAGSLPARRKRTARSPADPASR